MEQLSGKHVLITEGLKITAWFEEGEVRQTVGVKVKAEQIEMNVVKLVKKDGSEEYLELSDTVRWLPEKEMLN